MISTEILRTINRKLLSFSGFSRSFFRRRIYIRSINLTRHLSHRSHTLLITIISIQFSFLFFLSFFLFLLFISFFLQKQKLQINYIIMLLQIPLQTPTNHQLSHGKHQPQIQNQHFIRFHIIINSFAHLCNFILKSMFRTNKHALISNHIAFLANQVSYILFLIPQLTFAKSSQFVQISVLFFLTTSTNLRRTTSIA